MKILAFTLIIFSSVFIESLGQCNAFFDLNQGTQFERESYNAKGKSTGKSEFKVSSFSANSGGFKAKLNMTFYDSKDKLLNNSEIEVSCVEGVYEMDMTGIIPQETLKAFSSLETTMETASLAYPSDLSIGENLENGFIEINATSPIPLAMRIDMLNRKIEGKEKITTPAGTFDCYKISYDLQMKSIFSMSSSGVDYIAKGVGVVKTESYKPNGKIGSYSLLTSYSK